MFINKKLSRRHLPLLITSCLVGSALVLNGCSSSGDDSSGSNAVNIAATSGVPSAVVVGNSAIFESVISVAGSQTSNALKFALGANAVDTLSTITSIAFPAVSGVTFTQIIPNGSALPDCSPGFNLSNAIPTCVIKASIQGSSGDKVNDDFVVVTSTGTLTLPVVTEFVGTGSTLLPNGSVAQPVTFAPDTIVQFIVTNPVESTEGINNLQITIADWLGSLASGFSGGTVTTNDNDNNSKTITFTVEGLAVNLAPGQSHTFSFTLSGDSAVSEEILNHYDDLINNASTAVVSITAANLRNTVNPTLAVSLSPAIISDVVLTDPNTSGAATLQNISSDRLSLTSIDNSNLPSGATVTSGGTCVAGTTILEPKNDVGNSCTIALDVSVDTAPEANKTLSANYTDSRSNSFTSVSSVTIGGASVSFSGLSTINRPATGTNTTDVTITNTADLNWTPSNIPTDYEIKLQGESALASNISVIAPTSGISCLEGAAVAPNANCLIGIQTATATANGTYVLSLVPANNLLTTATANFTVADQLLGAFSFQNSGGNVLTSMTFEIGSGAQTLYVKNTGDVEITSFGLSIPSKLSPATNNCNPVLNTGTSCYVNLSVPSADGIGSGAYTITATGDLATVSNSPLTLSTTVVGATVSFGSVNISQPNDSDRITDLTITNDGENTIIWKPSTNTANYAITSGGSAVSGLTINNTPSSNPNCLDGADVAINGSCNIGVLTTSGADVGQYQLTLNLDGNLAAEQTTNFNVINSLGYFEFLDTNNNNINTVTVGIGDSDTPNYTLKVKNAGNTDITNFNLSFPSELDSGSNTCISSTLSAGAECSFGLRALTTTGSANQGQTYTITTSGANAENTSKNFSVLTSGTVVQIQALPVIINRPATGTQTTDIELKNISNISWEPSINAAKYQIVTDNDNIDIVAPSSGTNCLDGVDVTSNNSCFLGIQTNTNTVISPYTLTALATENLPQNSSSQTFNVADSLGYFVYLDSNENVITTLDLTIDSGGVVITLENIGNTEIAELDLNTSSNESKFNVLSSGSDMCVGATTLAANAKCDFGLQLSNSAVVDETLSFETKGSGATVSNSPVLLSVTTVADEAIPCGDDGGTCRVFVTQSTGNGVFSNWTNSSGAESLDAANNICAGDGNNPGTTVAEKEAFRAWVSTDSTDAKDNIKYTADRVYSRLDGTVIAAPSQLLSGTLEQTITAAGASAAALTGTESDGKSAEANCNNWTHSIASVKGVYGATGSTSYNWTANAPYSCTADSGFKLYCFEAQ